MNETVLQRFFGLIHFGYYILEATTIMNRDEAPSKIEKGQFILVIQS